jgi:predicted enzyme related to lactoylglutathione lyase
VQPAQPANRVDVNTTDAVAIGVGRGANNHAGQAAGARDRWQVGGEKLLCGAMGSRFCRYELRTTDVGAARQFYTELFGPELWGHAITVVPLPERAAARGAPAHWLGHICVDDVDDALRRFAASGAEQLGPLERHAAGTARAIVRDPNGAVVALTSEQAPPPGDRIKWHVLHAKDEERAFATYGSLFGWAPAEFLDRGPELGRHRMFTWEGAAGEVGSVANTGLLPGVHPQWLFFFGVASIEESLATVRARGGFTLEAVRMSSGHLVAACDDPEGAAFGLYQTVIV